MKKILFLCGILLIKLCSAADWAIFNVESNSGTGYCSIVSCSVNSATGIVDVTSCADVTPDITTIMNIHASACRVDFNLNVFNGYVYFNLIDTNYQYTEYNCPIQSDGTLGTCSISGEIDPAVWWYKTPMYFTITP